MSGARQEDDRRPSDESPPPTASFDGSAIGPGGQIGPFRIERELGRGHRGNSAVKLYYILLDCEGYYTYPIPVRNTWNADFPGL